MNTKLAPLATKVELKAEQDKIMKLQAFDSSYFHGQTHFEDDGTENYLHISSWKWKGLSDESIKPPVASNNSIAAALNHINTKSQVKFDGSC